MTLRTKNTVESRELKKNIFITGSPDVDLLLNKNLPLFKEVTKKYDPKTPEIVFFGLIEINFFHLNILPKTYPPISELIQTAIAK